MRTHEGFQILWAKAELIHAKLDRLDWIGG